MADTFQLSRETATAPQFDREAKMDHCIIN